MMDSSYEKKGPRHAAPRPLKNPWFWKEPRFLRPGCSIIRASLPFANIGVLRAGRAQPLYLLTPAGRFALRATAHWADASLRCAHGFAALANIGVLRAGRAQPLYLLTPAGRFALRATAHWADASLRCAPGRFATSGGKCPQGTRFPSRLRTLATLTKNAAA